MLFPDFQFEKSLLPSHCRYLLGIDEVGRGPLAGPVTLGAFLLDLHSFDPQQFISLKVTDSKKLSAKNRLKINNYFTQNNFHFHTFSASSTDIDRLGIATCIYDLINSALKTFQNKFDFCLIDGNYKISHHSHPVSVIKGDSRCFSIAAASIVAKVDRDAQMDQFDKLHPQYGFSSHKGYGTQQHLAAIKTHGPCPIHRLSFHPLATHFKHQNTSGY